MAATDPLLLRPEATGVEGRALLWCELQLSELQYGSRGSGLRFASATSYIWCAAGCSLRSCMKRCLIVVYVIVLHPYVNLSSPNDFRCMELGIKFPQFDKAHWEVVVVS